MIKLTKQQEKDRADRFDAAVERHVHAGAFTKQELHWFVKNAIGTFFAAALFAIALYFQQPTPPTAPQGHCPIQQDQDLNGRTNLQQTSPENVEKSETFADPNTVDTQTDSDPPERQKKRPAHNDTYI